MKAINTFADIFEKSILNLIYKLRKSFSPKSVKETTEVIESLNSQYQKLIDEYELIKQKKSTLSKSERDAVTVRIAFLISKGHIKVNQ